MYRFCIYNWIYIIISIYECNELFYFIKQNFNTRNIRYYFVFNSYTYKYKYTLKPTYIHGKFFRLR